MKNVLLADEMGAGKTIETIGVINDNIEVRKVLIICPASLRINWKRELISWLARRNTTIGIADAKRGFPRADIVIVNYEILKLFHRNIHAVKWDMLVVDEAHYLKNGQANRTLEIVGRSHGDLLKRRPKLEAERALFLTGTPIVNRPFELWPLVHYLAPDEFVDRLDFIAQYCGGKVSGQRRQDIGEENLRRLHQKLTNTIMIRRLKKDVLAELPPKIRQVLVLPGDSAKGAVQKERQEFLRIQKSLSVLRMKAELAKCVTNDEVYRQVVAELRQAEIVTIQQITALRMQTAMAKVPLVVEHAHNILEHVNKLVIFAYHTSVIENLALDFGNAVVVLHGKIDADERQKRVDTFQNDPNCRVLIGAIKASGVGLTMIAAQV
jgi:SWI/SNF-related matrix-associated actin-dependent regulator 1 of chromatin subfamily A